LADKSPQPSKPPKPPGRPKMPSLVPLLKPYKGQLLLLVILTVAGSAVGLMAPQVVSKGIDAFTAGRLDLAAELITLTAIAVGTFVFGNLQNVVQTIASERVARDLRTRLADKVSQQTFAQIEAQTPAKLLTNFTSDIDAIKTFVAQAAPALVSSAFVIVAGSAMLLWINWKLALAVLPVLPLMAVSFFMLMARTLAFSTKIVPAARTATAMHSRKRPPLSVGRFMAAMSAADLPWARAWWVSARWKRPASCSSMCPRTSLPSPPASAWRGR